MLSQRINTLTDVNAGARIDVLEADLSVLGTVVRQVAEAVSDLEAKVVTQSETKPEPETNGDTAEKAEDGSEPVIPLETLRQALAEGRLVFHMQPVITLPQRRTHGYDLVPRLQLEDGELADTSDFIPRHDGKDAILSIERSGIEEAVTIVRRARTSGQPVVIYAPISRIVLSDRNGTEELVGLFDANRVIASSLVLRLSEREWRAMSAAERNTAAAFHAKGVGFALTRAKTLRLDFNELAGMGVTSIRIDAATFANDPTSLTDFHASDVAAYVARFDIDLMVENARNEQQILSALEDGIKFAIGPHIAAPAPIRADLLVHRDAPTSAQHATSG